MRIDLFHLIPKHEYAFLAKRAKLLEREAECEVVIPFDSRTILEWERKQSLVILRFSRKYHYVVDLGRPIVDPFPDFAFWPKWYVLRELGLGEKVLNGLAGEGKLNVKRIFGEREFVEKRAFRDFINNLYLSHPNASDLEEIYDFYSRITA